MVNSIILTYEEERHIVDAITNLQKAYHSLNYRSLYTHNCVTSQKILVAISILQKDVLGYKRVGELAKEFQEKNK